MHLPGLLALDDMWEQTRYALMCSQPPGALAHMFMLLTRLLQALLELIFSCVNEDKPTSQRVTSAFSNGSNLTWAPTSEKP